MCKSFRIAVIFRKPLNLTQTKKCQGRQLRGAQIFPGGLSPPPPRPPPWLRACPSSIPVPWLAGVWVDGRPNLSVNHRLNLAWGHVCQGQAGHAVLWSGHPRGAYLSRAQGDVCILVTDQRHANNSIQTVDEHIRHRCTSNRCFEA